MFEGPAALQVPGNDVFNYTASARGVHYGPAARWTNSDGEFNGVVYGAGGSARAVDAIDTAGVGSDTEFTILVPTSAGGESDSTATTIFLDADQTTNPVEGANKIAIGISGKSDADIALAIIGVINGRAGYGDFASSGVGQNGVQGVTAELGGAGTVGTTKITLRISNAGPEEILQRHY